MVDGSITDEQAHVWLQEVARSGWISLHYDNPGLSGEDRVEVSGGGYVRFKMSWSQPSNRAIWSLIDARFTGLIQTKVTYFGVWDDPYAGFLRAYAELREPAAILTGKGYILHAGSVVVSFG